MVRQFIRRARGDGVQYSVDAQVVKLGYVEWPSSAFHVVIWKIPNGKCLVNVLYVETE